MALPRGAAMLRAAAFGALARSGAASVLQGWRIRKQEVSILTFHRVSDEHDPLWPAMPVRTFSKVLERVAGQCDLIGLDGLLEGRSYGKRPLVAISFDDGYLDFYEHALPVIRRIGIPVTHCICPGLVDSDELPWTQHVGQYLQQRAGRDVQLSNGLRFSIPKQPTEPYFLALLQKLFALPHEERDRVILEMRAESSRPPGLRLMNWDELRACQATGVDIGSHSMTHSHYPGLEREDLLRWDISESRERIANELAIAPTVFAFPSGYYDARSLRLVESCGYKVALICEDQVFQLADVVRSGALQVLPRLNIADRSADEEWLRALGFHQRMKHVFGGREFHFDPRRLAVETSIPASFTGVR